MGFEDNFKKYHNANYHDGDSTFDERNYKKSNGDDFDNCFVQDCYDHFEAGAQSRQAEIDELQKKIDNLTDINESLVAYKNQLLDDIEGNKND